MKGLPKIVKNNGFLCVQLPSGEFLPETELNIQHNAGEVATATVTFLVDVSELKDDEQLKEAIAENKKLENKIKELKEELSSKNKNWYNRTFTK